MSEHAEVSSVARRTAEASRFAPAQFLIGQMSRTGATGEVALARPVSGAGPTRSGGFFSPDPVWRLFQATVLSEPRR